MLSGETVSRIHPDDKTKRKKTMELKVAIHEDQEGGYRAEVVGIHDEAGGYWAELPIFDGCFSEGETYDEALDNIADAAEGVLESMLERSASGRLTGFPELPERLSIEKITYQIRPKVVYEPEFEEYPDQLLVA